MASISTPSSSELAQEVLQRCLDGESWQCPAYDELIAQALAPDTAKEAGGAFFGILVEGLADRFERTLCDAYAELFSEAVSRVLPEVWPADLLARYQRIREVRPFSGDAAAIQHVFLLSRVTLGADIVVTSTIIDGIKQRFPNAELHFAGPKKNFELFAADERLRHMPVDYRRGGSLADRLQVWPDLQAKLQHVQHAIVVDPDSRYTQLGLLPVCRDDHYYFFETRAFGGGSAESLVQLTRRWTDYTFGVSDAAPFIDPEPSGTRQSYDITVSLGVGENENKRLGDAFEAELLKLVARTGRTVCVDTGAGGREADRVARAIEQSGLVGNKWNGSFAGFSDIIRGSHLYIGYDSAGQHAAAAAGVPLITVFAGYVSDRMLDRWQPTGVNACHILRAAEANSASILEQVCRLLHPPF